MFSKATLIVVALCLFGAPTSAQRLDGAAVANAIKAGQENKFRPWIFECKAGPGFRDRLSASADRSFGGLNVQLPHAIEDHGCKLSRLTHPNTDPLWDAQSTRPQLRKCQSKRKGVFIGAAIGTAVAGAFAVYLVKDLSGNVLGTTGGESRYVAYWMVGGAAAGALAGLAYCH